MEIYGKEVVYDCTKQRIVFADGKQVEDSNIYYPVFIVGNSDFADSVDEHFLYEYMNKETNEFYSLYFSIDDIIENKGLKNVLNRMIKQYGYESIDGLELHSKQFSVSQKRFFPSLDSDVYDYLLEQEKKHFGNTFEVFFDLFNARHYKVQKNEQFYKNIREYGIEEYLKEDFESMDFASVVDTMFKNFTYDKKDLEKISLHGEITDMFIITKDEIRNILKSIIKERIITKEIETEIHTVASKICLNPTFTNDRKIAMLYTFADILSQDLKNYI